MIYVQLFLSFLQIGLFSFGGGYAAMPLIQNQVVILHNWLTQQDFNNLITISQMTPGPIAVNSATFVGIKIAGIGGALVATLGCIIPSCIIVSLLAWLYTKYSEIKVLKSALSALRPAVVALIAGAGLSITVSAFWPEEIVLSTTRVNEVIIFAGALFLLRWKKMNPILVMILAGVANLLVLI